MFLNIRKSNKIALMDDKLEISYTELISEINRVKNYIDQRSIVFCLTDNNIESVIAYISTIEADAVPLLLSAEIDNILLDRLIEEYKPQYIISRCNNENFYKYKKMFDFFTFSVYKTENSQYKINENLQLLLTTSGSTGSPKLVRHKKGNIESNSLNIAMSFGWDENEIGLMNLPLSYTMGLSTINTHLFLGATCVMTNASPISKKYWDLLENKKITNIVGVPFSFELLDKLKFTKYNFPFLKSICQGGGKLSKELFDKIASYALKQDIKFFATYGATETTARMTFLDPDKAIKKTQSIGKAMPLGITYLTDTKENKGELCFQGPNVAMGYANTKKDLELGDTWLGVYKTGDIVEIDSDGDMFIVGRKKRFLKLSGHRISLDDTENLIKNELGYNVVCVGNDKKMSIFLEMDRNNSIDEIKNFLSRKTGLNHAFFDVHLEENILRKDNGKVDYSYYNSFL